MLENPLEEVMSKIFLDKKYDDIIKSLDNQRTSILSNIETYCNKFVFEVDQIYNYEMIINFKNNDTLIQIIEELRNLIYLIISSKANLISLLNSQFNRLKEEYFEKKGFKLITYYDGSYYIGNINDNKKKEGLGYYYDNQGYSYFGIWHNDSHLCGILLDKNEDLDEIFIGNFSSNYDFQGLYIPIYKKESQNISFIYGKFDNDRDLIEGCFVMENKKSYLDVYFGKMKNFVKNYDKAILINYQSLNPSNPFSIYCGSFSQDKKNGKGIYINSKEQYILELFYENNNIKNAKAIFLMNNNKSIFQGELFLKNKSLVMGNSGLIIFENSHAYKGALELGMKEGNGKYFFSNGKNDPTYFYLDGKFYNDKFIKGKIYRSIDTKFTQFYEIFSGTFDENLLKGKFCFSNKENYEGSFINGLKNGLGTYIYSDSSSYNGEWKDNKKHGQGTYLDNQLNEFKGIWDEDQLKEIQNYLEKR